MEKEEKVRLEPEKPKEKSMRRHNNGARHHAKQKKDKDDSDQTDEIDTWDKQEVRWKERRREKYRIKA